MKGKFNYRHIICIAITLGFIACGIFVFHKSAIRIAESGRDFGLSVAYFFASLFGFENAIVPTVTTLPSVEPIIGLPATFEAFKVKFGAYWRAWVSLENISGYMRFISNVVFWLCMVVLIALPFGVLLYIAFGRYTKTQNNDYNKDSRPLKAFKRFALKVCRPVKSWLKSMFAFIKERKAYWIAWLCMWLFYFNAFAIVLEFIAYYLYFVVSFDIGSVYLQVYKLFLDLSVPFGFIPLWAWAIIAYFILNAVCKRMAYDRLYHNERRNRGFINECGITTIVYGDMGAGKTTQISDMALSAEIQLRDSAFEIILETDMKFPFFPWCYLENELKRAIARHSVYSLFTARRFVHSKRRRFYRQRRKRRPLRYNGLFGYDYERYGLTYDDKLKLIDIWSAIEDYACAYLIYTVQSSLLIANYSVRSDNLFSDLGNFPLWNTDFFKRDSRLIDSYSRHAHILDFDMLRLGKKMLADNPNRNAFGFGIYIVSEIDKERKNTPELKDMGVKGTASECNQKNDLFNVLLKMSRHPCVVANRVFVKVFADLQRPSSLGADALELGKVVDIAGVGDMFPTLPFFSPFWLFDLLYSWLKPKFDNFYINYRYVRADNTLLLYILKGIMAKLTSYHDGIYNLFGSQTLALEVERGSRDGNVLSRKYFRMPKKIYSKRFCTDCLSGIFEARAAANYVGIDDLAEYAGIMASSSELDAQNSHFQREIQTLNSENKV